MPTEVKIQLEDTLARRLEEVAQARGLSPSDLVSEALSLHLRRLQAIEELRTLRRRVKGAFTREEIRSLREEGRM